MPAGTYTVEHWATWDEGGMFHTERIGSDGTLTIPLPEFHRDMAIKVRRLDAGTM
jgi:hypothetical protein